VTRNRCDLLEILYPTPLYPFPTKYLLDPKDPPTFCLHKIWIAMVGNWFQMAY
jgi:hypothetical protein